MSAVLLLRLVGPKKTSVLEGRKRLAREIVREGRAKVRKIIVQQRQRNLVTELG